jgi:Family of unknown function (DUF6496)
MATTRKKAGTNKSATKKSGAKKAGTKKSGAKKPSRKKTTRKKSGVAKRRYGPAASESVETEVREMNEGTLRSGGSGKKVTNRKQAIAIGLSKARRAGAKVPPSPQRKKK